jgi:hypothetical protein
VFEFEHSRVTRTSEREGDPSFLPSSRSARTRKLRKFWIQLSGCTPVLDTNRSSSRSQSEVFKFEHEHNLTARNPEVELAFTLPDISVRQCELRKLLTQSSNHPPVLRTNRLPSRLSSEMFEFEHKHKVDPAFMLPVFFSEMREI